MFIQFVTPLNLPCYRSWDFEVCAGVFELDLQAVRNCLSSARPNNPKWLPELEKIRMDCTDGDLFEMKPELADALGKVAYSLISTGKFRSARCPKCNKIYEPEEIVMKEWSFGSGLSGEGGHRFECPLQHTLYAETLWQS